MKSLWIGLLIATPVAAQTAEPVCIRAETVPGFEAWGGAGGETLAPGAPAVLALAPAATVKFTPAPARTPAADSYGGQYPLAVARPGTYNLALSGKAWIDVVRGGKRLVSTAHREGTPCSGIRKIVSFALVPGTYQVQLSEATQPVIKAMVVAARR